MPTPRHLTVALVAALAVLCIAWELWLAPLRPGGSMLALKALPLLAALPALWRGGVRANQWWSMLILAYLCEGVVRGMSDVGLGAWLGWTEAVLAALAFAAMLAHIRGSRAPAAGG
jgi:uncharacterized membrane protein